MEALEMGDDVADEILGRKRAGAVVDQYFLGRVVGKGFDAQTAGILASFPARDCRFNREARRGFGKKRLLTRADDGLDMGYAGMVAEGLQRPPEHRFSADELVLLG